MLHRPLPEEANASGNVYGGNIMRHMDAVGAIAGLRHARCRLVTAAVEYMAFHSPVKPGELMLFHGSVNAVWHTSMEVGIRTEAEHPFTGKVRHVCTCYLTFVAVDESGRPLPLPPIIPETDEDRRRMADAARRMALSRMEHKHEGTRMSDLALSVLPEEYSICQLPAAVSLPASLMLGGNDFLTVTRTGEENSLALSRAAADDLEKSLQPDDKPRLRRVDGYACLKVHGPLNFNAVGILAGLTTLLASASIPLFGVSTYDTDYLLLPGDMLPKAAATLRAAGHTVTEG